MAKEFKIWIHIEEIDEDKDTYEDIGMPLSCGSFDELDTAEDFADHLHECGLQMHMAYVMTDTSSDGG